MKPPTVLSALLFACFVNLASAADDHKGHAHNEKPGQTHTHDAKPQHGGVVSVIKDSATSWWRRLTPSRST